MSEYNKIRVDNEDNKLYAHELNKHTNHNTSFSNTTKYNEINNKVEKVTKKITNNKLLTSMVVVSLVGLTTVIPKEESLTNVRDFYVETSYNSLDYRFYLENIIDNNDISLVIYNDFTNRSIDVTDSFMEGSFDDLKPNMYYTLEIKDGNKVIESKKVKTKVEEVVVDHNFLNVTSDPYIGYGEFNFRLEIIKEDDSWDYLNAYICSGELIYESMIITKEDVNGNHLIIFSDAIPNLDHVDFVIEAVKEDESVTINQVHRSQIPIKRSTLVSIDHGDSLIGKTSFDFTTVLRDDFDKWVSFEAKLYDNYGNEKIISINKEDINNTHMIDISDIIFFDTNQINIPFPQVVLNKPVEFSKKEDKSISKKADAFLKEQKELSKDLENKIEVNQ